jgi:cytochrome c-type biogenesis protein CcmH
MSWLLAIALAGVAFALAAFAFRVAPRAWSALAAALALGLAGYALQASPGLPGAPAAPRADSDFPGEALKQARQAMVASRHRSTSPRVLTADAFAGRGQYANAAALLRGAVAENPRDSEAWLALGNVLVEHADGRVTEPALLAYRRAAEAEPTSIGAGYFLGLSLLRQGSIVEGRNVWAETLAQAPEDAAGREMLAEQLNRLNVLLQQAAEAAAQ